ncbi:MAG TPA: ABC transporter ATP-binding protein [Gemmataceae bacterium]|nr:ABC transporter ATP-binding protein [Gemmataceae bacterium]
MLLYEAQSLCKYYRGGSRGEVCAVDGVSLGIERGSLTILLGSSGAGKTTLLSLLGALERPTRGRLLFKGDDLGTCSGMHLARLRRRMGFVFQDFALIPDLSAEANITYALIPRGMVRAERQRQARELLARFGMDEKRNVSARRLSGGEQQRVAIARALAGEPDVLLADEPTSNLDTETTRELLAVFRELHAKGRTVILSSHDARLTGQATHVHELDKGRLKEPRRC